MLGRFLLVGFLSLLDLLVEFDDFRSDLSDLSDFSGEMADLSFGVGHGALDRLDFGRPQEALVKKLLLVGILFPHQRQAGVAPRCAIFNNHPLGSGRRRRFVAAVRSRFGACHARRKNRAADRR